MQGVKITHCNDALLNLSVSDGINKNSIIMDLRTVCCILISTAISRKLNSISINKSF
jgi:hypothetical protein